MKKKTGYVILGLLRDENLTGYEIKSYIDHRMSFFWQESYGQIYPELNALLSKGMIVEDGADHTENCKRAKIKYVITEKGLAEFNCWMKENNEKDTVRSEALLKFFLASDSNKEELIQHLDSFQKQNEDRLQLYRRFEMNLTEYSNVHDNHKHILEVLALGIKQQELFCSWSNDYIKRLKEGD